MTPTEPSQRIQLAEAFAQVADALAAEGTVETTLEKISRVAAAVIAACDHCGVAASDEGTLTTVVATAQAVRQFDVLQNSAGQGPAFDALRCHEVVQVDDLSAEVRWQHVGHRAVAETGIESVLVFPLFSDSAAVGVVQFCAQAAGAFSRDVAARSVGSVFAAHAVVALNQARRIEQLEVAIQTRDVIGQAKGILMAQERLTADQAFARLRDTSQRLNRKLRNVAEEVTLTGVLPSRDR